MSTFFCSDLARSENEQLFGTVKRIRLHIALEYASAWNRKTIESEFLPREVRQFVAQIRERIPETRFLLVRQKESKDRKPSCFLAVTQEARAALYQWQLDDYRDMLSLDVQALLDGVSPMPPRAEPMFLICNHGQHDKCCAKFGNPVLEAARSAGGGQIWESSHVGGCRFAANLVCLPHGLVYGHLSPPDSIRAIRDHKDGKIFLPKFRGRASFSKPVQAAEYFVRREEGIEEIDALCLAGSVQSGPASWTTTFALAGTNASFVVEHTAARSASPRLLACSDVEPEFVWINHLVSITRLGQTEQ